MLWHTIHVPVAIVKFDSELPFPYEISTPLLQSALNVVRLFLTEKDIPYH